MKTRKSMMVMPHFLVLSCFRAFVILFIGADTIR